MSEVATKRPPMAAPRIQPAPPPPPKSGRMALANVIRGKVSKPLRMLIYGVEGVGKSSFAAAAPKPIFLGAEDGTSQLDVARFPQPTSWEEGLEAITELTSAEHDFKTLAVDTLDAFEPLCWAHVCANKRDKKGKRHETIEEFGYGAGYSMALDYWRVFLAALERLSSKRSMNIVLIAHAQVKNFKNPIGDDFDRYQLKLHEKAAGLMREWSEAVLFANYETFTHEKDGRNKGILSGARIVHTERIAAWDAKNRFNLPATLPLDWDSFVEAVAEGRPEDPAKLLARIEELLQYADEAVEQKVRQTLERVGDDAAQLARIANKLAAQVGTEEQEAQHA